LIFIAGCDNGYAIGCGRQRFNKTGWIDRGQAVVLISVLGTLWPACIMVLTCLCGALSGAGLGADWQ